MKSHLLIPAVCLTLIIDCFAWSAFAPVEVRRDVYLMGTRASLQTYAPDRDTGLSQIESFLRVLEDTEGELSTWREASAISRLNRQPLGESFRLNPSLCNLFSELKLWTYRTEGTFDPGIGTLVEAWRVHDGGRHPTNGELAIALDNAGFRHFDLDEQGCVVTRNRPGLIDVGAFGKGDALDRVSEFAADAGIDDWMIDLGGQILVRGTPPEEESWSVDVAHPFNRTQPVLTLALKEGSLATSGGSERDVAIGNERIGHILDPGTGQPLERTVSVTVWHPRALVADILSTALYVMGEEEGLRWAETFGIAAIFLTPRDEVRVEIHASPVFEETFLKR